MNNEQREEVALFRYGLIAPILNKHCDRHDYLSEICAKKHNVPYFGIKEFSPSTIERWLSDYKRWSFQGLKPRMRNDKGSSRALSPTEQELIMECRHKNMHLSTVSFYELCVEKGLVSPQSASYHSIYRILSYKNLIHIDKKSTVERKRFEYDTVNTLWQGDMSVGPYLTIRGRKHKTFLFAFIDDCSRLVPYAEFFYKENFEPMKKVLKEGMLRRGKPTMIYVDNGKVYCAATLHLACAKLGISLIHTKPYDPEAKGKIERFFGTVRRCFYPSLINEPVNTLEELNERFVEWLDLKYHRKEHGSLKATPLDTYMAQIDRIKHISDPTTLDFIFWHKLDRKVKRDGTISIKGVLFQVPLRYVGNKIDVRFDNYPPKDVFIFENDVSVCKIDIVSLNDNARVRRSQNIPEDSIDFKGVFSGRSE